MAEEANDKEYLTQKDKVEIFNRIDSQAKETNANIRKSLSAIIGATGLMITIAVLILKTP